MVLSGLLASIFISFTSFQSIGTVSNDDITVDNVRYSSYSEAVIYSTYIDDYDRVLLDTNLLSGFLIYNVDIDEYFYFLPFQVYYLDLPYYEDIYYYDLYFTLEDYSIDVNNDLTIRWSYDIESFCFDSSLGVEYLKSVFTRSQDVIFSLPYLFDYNISDLSLFTDLLMSNFPRSLHFTVDCTQYFNLLNNLYDTGYEDGVSQSFDEGYNSGYNEGYDEGFDWGQELGYNAGYSDGSSSSLASPFDIIRSALKGPIDLLSLEIAPNITIGTIVLIPLAITIIVFLLKGLVM